MLTVKRPATAEKPGDRRALRDGERGEPEAAAGHQVRLAAGSTRSPPDGAPHDVCGESARPKGRREFEVAGRSEPQEVEVFDLRAPEAEVKKLDTSQATYPRRGRIR